mmetsp:Transcript_2839/g.9603  ORF Transcript_2839/g.9603 Transcript_2839/m.9603 type:complete len:268 (-) Transcript_2839:436-1239(-)
MPAAHGTVALHCRVTPWPFSRAMRRRNKRAELQTESAASKLSSAQPFHRRPLCAGCHTTGSSAKWPAIHPRSSALRLLGKRISSRTRSSPNSDGTPCTGIPSPGRTICMPGVEMPALAMTTSCPSKCRIRRLKPNSACRKLIRRSIERCVPSRRNTACVSGRSFSRTSPGTTPGLCSLARSKVTIKSSGMPRSTTASSVRVSSLQRSSDGTTTSWLISIGPILRCTVLVSAGHVGPQSAHFGRPAPPPLQPRHMTLRRTLARTVPPL